MGHCMFLRKGETHTAPVNYKANFSDNTWEQIIDACQKNAVPDTWLVADQKTMTINGTDYLIDIIGKNHDTYSDGSGTAPLTFQMHNLYSTKYVMNSNTSNSNSCGWTDCLPRSTYLPNILSTMPTEVQASIKEVNKLTYAGTGGSGIITTPDKLFFLSEIEVFNYTYRSRGGGEGVQYEYYKAGNSSRKSQVGSSTNYQWWLRSPYTDSWSFAYSANNSDDSSFGYAYNYAFLAFAFCF